MKVAADDDGLYRIDLPPAVAGELLSAEVWQRRAGAPQSEPELVINGRPLRLQARSVGAQTGWLSERFPADSGPLTARMAPAEAGGNGFSVRIYGWR